MCHKNSRYGVMRILTCFKTHPKFHDWTYSSQISNQKRTRLSWPQVGGSWQISRFHMKYTTGIFSICLNYDFLKPLKIWVHLDNFYFHCFIGGTKGKNSKSLPRLSIFLLLFFPLVPQMQQWKQKLSKWAQIFRGFRRS